MTFRDYFSKMRGTRGGGPPRVGRAEIFWSWLGGFVGISAVSWANQVFVQKLDLTLMAASFGASAVLVYGAIRSPLAQPRNVLGGQVLSAIVGVTCWKLLHDFPGLAAAMAVATAIAVMHATRCLHPPGGATSLLAVIGSPQIHKLGYLYVLVPVATGSLILLAVALVVNNLPQARRYPEAWF